MTPEQKQSVKEYMRQWRESHSSYMREYGREWARQHYRSLTTEQKAEYQTASNERKRRRGWYKEYQREYTRNLTSEQKSARRSYRKKWRKAHPEVHLIDNHRRRCGRVGSFTAGQWFHLVEKYDHRCLCCNKREPEIKLTADHVVPVVKGGTSFIENIQPLCTPCNSRKGTKMIDFR